MDRVPTRDRAAVRAPVSASGSSIAIIADRQLTADALMSVLRSLGSSARVVDGAQSDANVSCLLVAARTAEAAGNLVDDFGLVEEPTPIVLLAGGTEEGWDALARAVRARAWLPPDSSAADLGNALAIDVPVTANADGETGDALRALTRRERAVLLALADGAPPIEIAASLGISVHTVRTHLANAMRKLGVSSRSEAVATARQASPVAQTEPAP